MEANPGTVTKEKLADYLRCGINRLSFGLQSTNDRELSLLGRIHTFEKFLESYRLAREAGFKNINIDLMSALPGQTVETWMETLKRTVDLEPEHISAYSLIIEEGTPFYDRYSGKEGERLLPDEDSEREMYHRTKEYLRSCGYERYEISNYAKKDRECRHNIGYWTGVPYLGLGLGASSYMDGKRFRDAEDLGEYLKSAPGSFGDFETIGDKERQEEFFFVGLRLMRGVSLKKFEEEFHMPANAVYPGLLEKLVLEKMAALDGEWFALTEYGIDISNRILSNFLQD
jgi:oxygen-independent coproporphyrinogen-3 oxidase